jgi:hypothetical protein
MLFSTSPKLRQITRTAHLLCLAVGADTRAADPVYDVEHDHDMC